MVLVGHKHAQREHRNVPENQGQHGSHDSVALGGGAFSPSTICAAASPSAASDRLMQNYKSLSKALIIDARIYLT